MDCSNVEKCLTNCEGCPFKGIRIKSRGNPSAPIVLVGEGPTLEEVRKKRIFEGPAVQLLSKALPAGINIEDCYLIDAIECSPKNKTPQSMQAAVKCCRERLLAEIKAHPRKLVITLGAAALWATTGNYNHKITQVRGQQFESDLAELGILATIHPAYVIRGGGNIKHLKGDLEEGFLLANGESKKNYILPEFRVLRTAGGIKKLCDAIRKQKLVGADIETSGFSQFQNKILCIGIAWDPAIVYIVDCRDDPTMLLGLRDALEDPEVKWLWHNGKFDIKFLREPRCVGEQEAFQGIQARVDEDTMLLNYCLSPETRILKTDLTWKRIDQLQVGDEVIGFDEFNQESVVDAPSCTKLGSGKAPGGIFKSSKVLKLNKLKAPKYKLVTAQGTVIASAHHMWAARIYGQRWVRWISTETLARLAMEGKKAALLHFVSPWETQNNFKAGYIAGILDGEGCLASGWTGNKGDSNWSLGFSQKAGIVLTTMLNYLKDFGYVTNLYKYDREGITRINFRGYRESLRVIGTFRPQRMLEKSGPIWQGIRKCAPAKIISAEYLGEGEVIGIETETKTLIAEGFKSHNCLDETSKANDLGSVAIQLLGCPDWKSELDKHLPKKGASYETIAIPVLHDYLAKDVSSMLQCHPILRKQVAEDKDCEKLYTETLIPACEMLYHVERRGFYTDAEWWKRQEDRLKIEVDQLQEEINKIVGYDINPRSPQQVCHYAYKVLKIKSREQSSDAKIVAKWPDIPFKFALQKYRKVAKALSTYVIGYAECIEPCDKRIHPTFKLHRTPTGRLACGEPNLQNIPRDPLLKGMYCAAPGHILIEADYSQAELRSLAVQSGDKALLKIFNTPGMSLHKEVAKFFYGPNYTPDQYVRAKAVNFGIVYGITAFSIAEEHNISKREAQLIIDKWFIRFPQAKSFIDKCRATVVQGQTMVTIFGRKKRAKYPSREMLNNLQNEAANFPHQSTASDFTLKTAIRTQPVMASQWNAHIVDLVHDSMIIECPDIPEVIEAVSKYVAAEMEATPRMYGITSVPFLADIKLAYNWGNAIHGED